MSDNQSKKAVARRRVSEADSSLATRAVIGTTKVTVTALALINADPTAAILAGLAAELSGILVEQREARVIEYLGDVIHKVRQLPLEMRERWQSRFDEPEGRAFFEAAWHQAAETVDPEKVEAIASLVKNSLSAEELQLHHARWLLRLIDELDAVEMILLQKYCERYRNSEEFLERHKTIFEGAKKPEQPRHPHSGLLDYPSQLSQEQEAELERRGHQYQIERERHALYVSRVNHLVETGLLGDTGNTWNSQLELTSLGTALLKIIDLADDNEWGKAEQASVVEVLRRAEAQNEGLRRSINEKEKQYGKEIQSGLKQFEKEFVQGIEEAARRYRR